MVTLEGQGQLKKRKDITARGVLKESLMATSAPTLEP